MSSTRTFINNGGRHICAGSVLTFPICSDVPNNFCWPEDREEKRGSLSEAEERFVLKP